MKLGLLIEKDDSYDLVESKSSIAIPSTLQDSLLARLDRLSEVRDVVQMGAVLGREFSFDMLTAVLPRKTDQMERSLSKLLENEIFQERKTSGVHSGYQFKHALIQDAAYESLLKSDRHQLHHRVANVLEHQFTNITQSQPEILAHHYTEASMPVQALPIWLKAGQQASQKNASSEAIAHLVKGLGLLDHLESQEERKHMELDFKITLGGTYVVSHGFPHPKVKETFNNARDIAQNMDPSPKLALVLFNLLGYYFNTEDYAAAHAIADHMMTLAQDPEHGYWFEISANQLHGGVHGVTGNFERAAEQYSRVLSLFDPKLPFPWELAPSGYIEIGAKAWLMVMHQILGQLEEARDLFDHHLSYANDHEDSMTLYHIYTFPALYSLLAREWRTAEEILDRYLPIVREFGDQVFMLTADVYDCIARAFQDDREAFEKSLQFMSVCFDIGFKAFATTVSFWIAELYNYYSDHEGCIAWCDKILAHTGETGTTLAKAELIRIRGLALQQLGKPTNEIEDHFKEALDIARSQSAKLFELRAVMDLAKLWNSQNRKTDAIDLLEQSYNAFTGGFDSVDLQEAKSLLEDLQ